MLTHFFCFPLTGVRGDFLVICTQTLNTESDIINVKSGEQKEKTSCVKRRKAFFFLPPGERKELHFKNTRKETSEIITESCFGN